ncbi:unnamed protein product [Pleuronectes platessa]|uniref:Uncharacterized protein n=1 Tax=Pleuronectes platessa TaxID=8262 RepID=A0A9N7UJZ1_PLEPL|nr:unnamed protein product [Pleuronectes platessa]
MLMPVEARCRMQGSVEGRGNRDERVEEEEEEERGEEERGGRNDWMVQFVVTAEEGEEYVDIRKRGNGNDRCRPCTWKLDV